MSIKALSDYTFYSRYARYDETKKRRETWEEAVSRVFDMHKTKYASQIKDNPQLLEFLDFAQQMQNKKRVLAAQRSLQFAGPSIFKHELKMYNCLFSHIDRERVFQETMYSLLCGCGVGFSVQKHHVSKIGTIKPRTMGIKTYIIEDSIEGWSDAIGVLINSYFQTPVEFEEYNGYGIVFDFSNIRPEGSLIAGQFKAPGHKGLESSLNKVQTVIENRLNSDDFMVGEFAEKFRPIDAYDIIMHISDAVLSGGVRRSATLAMFSKDDIEMLNAKTGNWFIENPQRGRSNNSVTLLKGSVSKEEFSNIMESTKQFGEPGFIWTDDLEAGFNPCVTGDALIDVKDHACMVDGKIISDGCEYKIPLHILVELVNEDASTAPFVLSFNTNTQKLEWARVTAAALTRKSADVIKLHLDDGKTLKCTPDHKILTSNRGYVMAKDLNEADDIVTL